MAQMLFGKIVVPGTTLSPGTVETDDGKQRFSFALKQQHETHIHRQNGEVKSVEFGKRLPRPFALNEKVCFRPSKRREAEVSIIGPTPSRWLNQMGLAASGPRTLGLARQPRTGRPRHTIVTSMRRVG